MNREILQGKQDTELLAHHRCRYYSTILTFDTTKNQMDSVRPDGTKSHRNDTMNLTCFSKPGTLVYRY